MVVIEVLSQRNELIVPCGRIRDASFWVLIPALISVPLAVIFKIQFDAEEFLSFRWLFIHVHRVSKCQFSQVSFIGGERVMNNTIKGCLKLVVI